MMRARYWWGGLVLFGMVAPSTVLGQGARLTGFVIDSLGGAVSGAVVEIRLLDKRTLTDSEGHYELVGVPSGRFDLVVRKIGFSGAVRSVAVGRADSTYRFDFRINPTVLRLEEVTTRGRVDRLLDPSVVRTEHVITNAELRQLPVTTLDEAVALQPGVVEGSFRGGRLGQDVLVLDGLRVKNQFDASTKGGSLRIPVSALSEASVITNGFSARYGQALSGVVEVSTREPGDRLVGAIAYDTDRVLPEASAVGLDRVEGWVAGPVGIGGLGFLATVSADGRVDDLPTAAPLPDDPLDPWSSGSRLLPNNSGQRVDVFGKLLIPLGRKSEVSISSARSYSRRLLYDHELKYAPDVRLGVVQGSWLGALRLSVVSADTSFRGFSVALDAAYIENATISGTLAGAGSRPLGPLSTRGWWFAGQELATSLDSVESLLPIPGMDTPGYAVTPYGVPAYFRTASSRGELRYSRYRELRSAFDMFWRPVPETGFRLGGEVALQRVASFQRVDGFMRTESAEPIPHLRPPLETALDPAISNFAPRAMAAYTELHQRLQGLGISLGLRMDGFNGRRRSELGESRMRVTLSPRLAVGDNEGSTTFIASVGRFAQAPDYQFLADASFSDSLRTGRSRVGNPNSGFESATQFELGVRHRLDNKTSLTVGAYYKRMEGLIASVPLGLDPDSTIFGNADFGTARGMEVTIERELVTGLGVRVSYSLQNAKVTANDGFAGFRFPYILVVDSQVIDTITDLAFEEIRLNYDRRHSVVAVLRASTPPSAGIVGDLDAGVVFRYSSGLPWTRTTVSGDTIIGVPNAETLPSQLHIDAIVRKSFGLGGSLRGSVYLDIRNVLNCANVVAVRGFSGNPGPSEATIDRAVDVEFPFTFATIPRESPRYRGEFDTNGDGLLTFDELPPLYRRAAVDFLQPVFEYGPPRTMRVGMELAF